MPQVHFVKKARKANKAHGIKKGDSYYWWKNRAPGARSGVKRISKTRPRPSQTTGNPFMSQVYAIQESMDDCHPESLADIESQRDGWVEEIRALAEETEEKLNNMPDGLREGDTGQMLQERVDALNQWADDVENVDLDPGTPDEEDDHELHGWSEVMDEIRGCDPGL